MLGLSKEKIERMREKYVGKKVQVEINDIYQYFFGTGIVESVDDMGIIRGHWVDDEGNTCGLGVCLDEDYITILED